MKKSSQRVLVSGATGFIGSHLVRKLIDEGFQVWIVVRPSTKVKSELAQAVHIIVHEGDVGQLSAQIQSAKISGVLHLATEYASGEELDRLQSLIQSNIIFGTELLAAACQANVSWFINTGSYWQHYQQQPYSPVDFYAATKQAFLALAQYYYETSPLNFLTLELSDTFGPNDPRPKLLNLWLSAAASGTPLEMSAGEQKINLNYIDDVVNGFILAARMLMADTQRKQTGKVYTIRARETCTLRELARMFEKVSSTQLPIVWGKRAYRKREVMEPWQGELLPGYQQAFSLLDGLAAVWQQKDSK